MSKHARSRWGLKWTDHSVFKIEQEGDGLTETSIEEWGAWLDAEVAERFGNTVPRLTAASINFSRCGLDDAAVRTLADYLYSRDIAVQTLKLFRNSIGDSGAWAIGQVMAHSSQPVQEVHLSHNSITEQGACSLLESIAWCERYPHPAETGRRDSHGLSPVWLRLEHNFIDWKVIDHRLNRLTWCTAESKDGWAMCDRAPAVCLHSSFRNQHERHAQDWSHEPSVAASDGSFLLAALRGDGPAKESLASQLSSQPPQQVPAWQEGAALPEEKVDPGQGDPSLEPPEHLGAEAADGEAAEEVPLYVFLDVDAALQMITREDGLLRFRGLANLCAQGHMKCSPPDESRQLPSWVGAVQEGECIMFAITDLVMDELEERSQSNPYLQHELQRFKAQDPESALLQCLEWGIFEVLETTLHTQMMRLGKEHEPRAKAAAVSLRSLKMLDFTCLWQSQIESEGRVLLLTEDFKLRKFGGEVSSADPKGQWPKVLMLGELNQLFKQDTALGGNKLTQASLQAGTTPFCGAVFSASMLNRVAAGSSLNARFADQEAAPVLRQELHEAVAVLTKALSLLRTSSHSGAMSADKVAQAARLEKALARWHVLLAEVY
eukprot:TRINITY_DN23564_c0_g1_i1.p1 TRINITY_DN23564_c0_g1~~TRINITY_DN23564_c0_g1_i1.p1  ORF type:complete len:605 (+),score=151.93 TRINITY_DN23564_c0_g1_i1:96-1910(+)